MRRLAPLFAVLLLGCPLSPPQLGPSGGDDAGQTEAPDAGPAPTKDAGLPPVEDAGEPPVVDAGEPPVDDAGPDAGEPPVEDAGPAPCNADGVRNADEGCDDGNRTAGDGCSADCRVELDYVCLGDVGALSFCALDVDAMCAPGLRVDVPLSFTGSQNISNGELSPTGSGGRFNDVGGLGALDLVIASGSNLGNDSGFLTFRVGSAISFRFLRAGTEAPLAVVGPAIRTGDHEDSDLLGPLTFTAWGEVFAPAYANDLIFSGGATPDGVDWRGTSAGLVGFQEEKTATVDLSPFMVTALDIRGGGGSNVGLSFDGQVTVCLYDGCGDGEVNALEDEVCDDGNRRDGDGCASGCALEPGAECTCRSPFREAGAPVTSSILGGDGGSDRADVDCAAGKWAVGVDGVYDNEDRVRGLQLLCVDLQVDDELNVERLNEERSAFAGNNSGVLDDDLNRHLCPDGQVLTALHAELRESSSLFANVELGCRELLTDGTLGQTEARVFFDGTQTQNGQGVNQSADCGTAGVVTGFRDVKVGDSLDQVAVACTPVTALCGSQSSVCVP